MHAFCTLNAPCSPCCKERRVTVPGFLFFFFFSLFQREPCECPSVVTSPPSCDARGFLVTALTCIEIGNLNLALASSVSSWAAPTRKHVIQKPQFLAFRKRSWRVKTDAKYRLARQMRYTPPCGLSTCSAVLRSSRFVLLFTCFPKLCEGPFVCLRKMEKEKDSEDGTDGWWALTVCCGTGMLGCRSRR